MTSEKTENTPRNHSTRRKDMLALNPAFREAVSFKSDIFQNYSNEFNEEKLIQSASSSEKDTLLKKLSSTDNVAITEIKKALAECLNNQALVAAEKEYQAEIKKLKTLLPRLSTRAALTLRKETYDKTREQISGNFSQAQQEIEKKFHDSDFKKHVAELYSLNENDDEALQNIKEEVISALTSHNKKLLEEFEKANTDELKALHKEEQHAIENVLFLKKLSFNKKMSEQIEGILLNKQQAGSETTLSFNDEGNYISSDDLKTLEKINHFDPKGGLFGFKPTETAITKDPETGEYRIQFGKPLYPWNMGYSLLNKNKEHLLNMATLVRLAGNDSIHVNVEYSDDKKGLETARRAYEACIKAGFPPEKITINYKGQTLAHKEGEVTLKGEKIKAKSISEVLFADRPNKYQHLQKSAPEIQKQLNDLVQPNDKPSYKELSRARQLLKEGRTQQANTAASQENTAERSSETLRSPSA